MSASQTITIPCQNSSFVSDVNLNKVSPVKTVEVAAKSTFKSGRMAASTSVVIIIAAIIAGLCSGAGMSYFSSPVIIIAGLLSLLFLHRVVWSILIYPRYSRFAHIPAAPQVELSKRLLKEPVAGEFERWINEVPNEGLIRYYGMFNEERLLVTSPEGIKDLVQVQAENNVKGGPGIKFLKKILPYGLVTVNEPNEHKFQRRVIQPAFKHKNVRDLYPVFWKETQHFIDILKQHLQQQQTSSDSPFVAVNVFDWISRATMDVITLTAFGGSYHALQNPESDIMKSWETFRVNDPQVQAYAALSFLLPEFIWGRLPVQARRRLEDAVDQVNRHAKVLIEARRKSLASAAKGMPADSSTIKIDIISTILKSPQTFTNDQLTGQAITFLLAGHDTTATALTWTLYLLARYPSTQTRLRSELRSKIPSLSPSSNRETFDFTSLESLTYLNAVLSETLRLFPPVPHIRRQISQPNTVVLGVPVPVGTSLYSSPWALNRSKAVWGSDALEFKPDRFIDSKTGAFDPTGGATNPYAMYTFGKGPRNCIGEQFARSELLVMLTGLVAPFEWKYLGKVAGSSQTPPPISNTVTTAEIEPINPDESTGTGIDVSFGVISKPASGKLWLGARKLEGW